MKIDQYFKLTIATFISIIGASAVLLFPSKIAIISILALAILLIIFVFHDKKKALVGAFLFTLPLSMGLTLMQRVRSTNTEVNYLFQIYLSDIFLILFLILSFINLVKSQSQVKYRIIHSRLALSLFLWVAFSAFSIIPAIDKVAAAAELVKYARVFLTFYCIFQYLESMAEEHYLLNGLIIITLLQSILMFAQYLNRSLIYNIPGMDMGLDIISEGIRPSGTLGLSSTYAKLSGLIIPLLVGKILSIQRIGLKIRNIIILLCIISALFLTVSRIGIIALVVSIVLFFFGLFVFGAISIRRLVPLFTAFVILITICVGSFYFTAAKQYESRIHYDAYSAAARVPMWKVAFNVIKAHPFFGVGLSNYTLVHQRYDFTPEQISFKLPGYPVHNLFLLFAAETGIIGLMLFLWFIYELIRQALKIVIIEPETKEKVISLSIIIGIVNLLIQSMTGKGAIDHPIILSVVAIYAAIIAKRMCIVTSENKNTNIGFTL